MPGGDGVSVLQIRAHGCSYRIGERPQDIMARSRSWMLWLPWAAMASISVLQYGYGVAVIAVQQPQGPATAGAFWVLALWVVFQAAATSATPILRRRLGIGPSTAMSIGALLSAIGPFTLSCTANLGLTLLGYSVLCGTGAGSFTPLACPPWHIGIPRNAARKFHWYQARSVAVGSPLSSCLPACSTATTSGLS